MVYNPGKPIALTFRGPADLLSELMIVDHIIRTQKDNYPVVMDEALDILKLLDRHFPGAPDIAVLRARAYLGIDAREQVMAAEDVLERLRPFEGPDGQQVLLSHREVRADACLIAAQGYLQLFKEDNDYDLNGKLFSANRAENLGKDSCALYNLLHNGTNSFLPQLANAHVTVAKALDLQGKIDSARNFSRESISFAKDAYELGEISQGQLFDYSNVVRRIELIRGKVLPFSYNR